MTSRKKGIVVSENIARHMDPAHRKALGIKTAAESVQVANDKSEKSEHQVFLNWCNLNEIPVRHDRTDKRVTGSVGWPDFLVVFGGRILPLEFKVGNNRLSPDQVLVFYKFAKTNTEAIVVYSAEEAIHKTRTWLANWFGWKPK